MFPHPGAFLLVARECGDGRDQQSRGAARPELEIGLEENSRRRAAGEPGVQPLRKPRVDLWRLLVRIVVEKDDVEVGGVAELLAAELAVADHREVGDGKVFAPQVSPYLI